MRPPARSTERGGPAGAGIVVRSRPRLTPVSGGILTPRTLANSHPALLPLLTPGLSVLDVGSGPGPLSAEIARRVDPGTVLGLDVNPRMVAVARDRYPRAKIPNLTFRRGDVRRSRWRGAFDLVNAASTLRWVPDPQAAVDRMALAVRHSGHVVVLDIDHVEWSRPPRAWTRLVAALGRWRAAVGLPDGLGGRLGPMLEAAGLAVVEVIARRTEVRAGDDDFFRVAGAWRMLAESRGRQVVAAGFCTAGERQEAIGAFTAWMQDAAAAQVTREITAIGRRAG